MRKSIFTTALTACIIGTTLIGCNTPAEKVEDAQENVVDAKEDLAEAKAEYLEDVENYRRETVYRIDANNQSIAEFRARIADEKREAKAEYEEKIAKLEQKNTDAKRKLDEYKVEGKDQWQTFKMEFNRDMDDIGKAIKDLTTKKNK